MADETHIRLGEGAAEAAPTAPHATPRARAKRETRTGPERFWSLRRMRIAYGSAIFASLVIHYLASPWSIFLPHEGLDIRDTEGDAVIPIDLLDEEEPPPKEEPPPEDPQKGQSAEKELDQKDEHIAISAGDASVTQVGIFDASADTGALAPKDAGIDAPPDAPADAPSDAPADAPADASDAATPAVAENDPQALIGGADVKAEHPNVVLMVNMDAIKTHPIGAGLDPVLRAIPQWDEFMAGTDIEPVRDTDWITVSGPSLADTKKDVIVIRYSAADAVVDKAVAAVASHHPGGGAYDAGVPNVKALLGHADGAVRIFLRPQTHVLAVVPQEVATRTAGALSKARVRTRMSPQIAFRMTLLAPNATIAQIPPIVKQVRLWVTPKANGAAEMFAEADCGTDAEAAEAADKIKAKLRGYTSNLLVKLATKGLFDGVEIKPEGTQVKIHLAPDEEQLGALLKLVETAVRDAKKP